MDSGDFLVARLVAHSPKKGVLCCGGGFSGYFLRIGGWNFVGILGAAGCPPKKKPALALRSELELELKSF